MDIGNISYIAVFVVSITGVLLLISNDWRWSTAALAIQYAGVFILVVLSWPIQMAAVKLVAGWMSGAILGMAYIGAPGEDHSIDEAEWGSSEPRLLQNLSAIFFRILAAVVVVLAVFSISSNATDWVSGVNIEQILGGLVLVGLGLLHLGFTAKPFRVVIGLLTVLAGFEILYAAVEISALVAGLLASVNLGLALIGAYLLVAPGMELDQ